MAEILGKPATVDEVLREVSHIKSVVTEAVDDGVRSALRAAKQGREFAEDTIHDATRAIKRIWRGGTACDRHAFVASAAEAEQLDAFDAQLAKVVAAVRDRWSN